MRYLGGKAKIAKRLAPKIAAPKVWEPFAGGLNMSRALAALGCDLWLSDAHPSLAPLYRAIRNGWQPPAEITARHYRLAKRLPDTHPFKALCGFGMSYGGKWFGGYAGAEVRAIDDTHRPGRVIHTNPAKAAGASLKWLRDSPNVRAVFTADFFDVPVRKTNITIYCDPPYADTTKYSGGDFDSALFWARCREWARAGARVLVSEHSCPIPHAVLHETQRGMLVHKKGERVRTERLFQVLRGLRAAFSGRPSP